MTQHDASTLPTHEPTGPGPRWTTRRPWTPTLVYSLGLLAVYLLAVCTPVGQRVENAVFDLGSPDAEKAWIYPWSGATYGSTPLPPLEMSHIKTLIVGLAVIAVVTVVRRCWLQGCAAVGIVVVTIGAKEVLKPVLPRPDLVNAPDILSEGSFPSGHTAIPAALTLGALLVASPRVRPYVTTAGVLWLACIAAAVQALGHHRQSDVLGATLLACICYSLVSWLLPAAAPDSTRGPRALPSVTLALSAAVVLAAGVRSDSLTRSLVAAAAAFGCAALLWYTATEGPARRTRHAPA
ncbi:MULTISPECIES: phosphatase PAP2 family protein [unclassified Streptomyces]|uniref:phosphatase PAP2 family protein n=1 Tax=unclassified Streptomyces TaxID=2593676 RepID=UPI000F6CE663|nr:MULTISPECIES: phosphatase PAP2 family protein [unclassified Streptomyces]AZM60204.1 prepilin peptidase [Streptomyces sp. WAC 01438]RSM97942.1 prepilin peptidase [Streptomyces sp. WAC 01420]